MAELNMSGFPEGTLVFAYLRRLWPGPSPQPGDSPRASPVGHGTADAHGYALIEELEDATGYYVGAQVNGSWRWTSALTPPGGGGGSGSGSLDVAAVDALLVARGVVKSLERELGSVSGTVTPNLAESNVFAMSLAADVTIAAPINCPTNTAATYVELKITTNGHKVAVTGITGWTDGEVPPGLDGSYAKLRIMLVTDNAGASYEGMSFDVLPSDVLRAALGTSGQFLGSDGAKPVYQALPASGLSQAEADARIKALSILTGAHPMLIANASGGAGQILYTTGTEGARWEALAGLVSLTAPFRLTSVATITKTTVLPGGSANKIYRVNKAGAEITLPSGEAAVDGEQIVIENTAAATIKVLGTIGTLTEVTMQPGEVLIFWGKETLSEWRIIGRYRQANDVVVPDIEIGAKTSAQITKAFEALFSPEKPPGKGQLLIDSVAKLMLFYNGTHWFKTGALTEI